MKESGSVWLTPSAVSCTHHSFSQQEHPPASVPLSGWSIGFHLTLQLWALWDRQVLCLCSTLAQNIIQDVVFNIKNLPSWQQGLNCTLTCNSFIPSLDFTIICPREQACTHQTGWRWGAKVLHVTSGACLPAEAPLSLGLHHQCPCAGTAAPQLPSWLHRSQDRSLQASVGWDSHEGRVVL